MKTVIAASCLALALAAGTASAANVLTVVGNDIGVPLTASYDPAPLTGIEGLPAPVLVDVARSTGFGLKLNDMADITFTYLGKEAGNLNVLFGTSQIFSTGAGEVNSALTLTGVTADANGFLPFSFTSAGATVATNGGPYSGNSAIAFKVLQDGIDYVKVLVMLDDPGADSDYDDMVLQIEARADKDGNIATTPLPGGVMLLLSGLAGLGYMGRARRGKKN